MSDWLPMQSEARRRARQATKLFKHARLHICPACGSKLEQAWPTAPDFPNEEFGYACGAIIIKEQNGRLKQDGTEGACREALSKALKTIRKKTKC